MTDRLRDAAQRALESLNALIADTLDPGVEALGARHELGQALLNTAPAVAPTAPPAADLRDRIAEALARADGLTWGPGQSSQPSGIIERYHRRADVVLAVLPAPTDQAAAAEPADRRARYAAAIRAAGVYDWHLLADAAMAVADAEQTALRAEAEGLDEALRGAISASEKEAAKARTTITRLRAERAELNRRLSCLQGDMRDMEHHVREETEDDDPICGDRYDDEVCELEPGHGGAHCAGTLCWDIEPAPAPTEEPTR